MKAKWRQKSGNYSVDRVRRGGLGSLGKATYRDDETNGTRTVTDIQLSREGREEGMVARLRVWEGLPLGTSVDDARRGKPTFTRERIVR